MMTTILVATAMTLGAPAIKPKNTETGPGYLGVQFISEPDGMRVSTIQPGGPAQKAGLLPNDLITRFDRVELKGMENDAIIKVVAETPIGRTVEVELLRGSEKMTVKVKVAGRPADFETLRQPRQELVPIP
ncbi:MAG: PDZ domain-containing protein [Zavarzinella sp.]